MDEAERAERDMMAGIIGGEEYRRRIRDFARDEQARFRAEAAVLDNEAGGYPDDEPVGQMQWVNCEACGGTGEIIRRDPVGPYDDPGAAEYAEICAACEGHGIDCEPR